jgi:predicted NUDIX family phosphoesterase
MEFVLVVPRVALADGGYALSAEELERVVAREGHFVERAYAERTPALKQIIPYTLVGCETEAGLRLLCTRRLKKGGEPRLHDKHSLGIGGHINPEDLEGPTRRNPLDAGTRREIEEELIVRGTYDVHRVGLLNDDTNPVGAVHVGIVQVALLGERPEIREKELLEGRLASIQELRAMLTDGVHFETWSKLLIPKLDELVQNNLAARCAHAS